MGLLTKIEWTDATWNVAIGCTKVSPGCKNCYMMKDWGSGSLKGQKDKAGVPIPVNGNVTRTKPGTFNKPLVWQKQGKTAIDGTPLKVFTSSLTDIFHEQIDLYRHEIWDIIKRCPDLIFQILTKRPERVAQCLPDDWGNGYDNVWIGVSVENQDMMKRVLTMNKFAAKVKFVSFEPLIGEIDINKFQANVGRYYSGFCQFSYIVDWAIIGGESGNETGAYTYRPAELDWYKELITDLSDRDIPTFFKQTGTHISKCLKKEGINIGRKGGDIFSLPKELDFLKVREFPKRVGAK